MVSTSAMTQYGCNPSKLATTSLSKAMRSNDMVIEVEQFDKWAVRMDGSGRVILDQKVLRKFDKIEMDRISGTFRTIKLLQTTNNCRNPSPANQRTCPTEQAQDSPQHSPKHWNRNQTLSSAPAVTIKGPLKYHCPPTLHSMLRMKLCWTDVSCPSSFPLDHPTRSPIEINLMKPGHPTRIHP